jgi:nucleotide-binding universal stress UspA family protein
MNYLVIAAHSTAGLMGLLLDDVAHQIIGHADQPILVASAEAGESR